MKSGKESDRAVKQEDWQWFGFAGHFICGHWCRFHLCTKVGPWLVSTVGAYVHPRHGAGDEGAEARWLAENAPGEDIGSGRKYETMVFRAGSPCQAPGCNCGMPRLADANALDFRGYNDASDAARGHVKLCRKWSKVENLPEPEKGCHA